MDYQDYKPMVYQLIPRLPSFERLTVEIVETQHNRQIAYLEGRRVYEINVMCFEILRVAELANNLWLVEMESDMVSR